MIKKINKRAHFWIRILSTIIDLIIFIIFAVGSSFVVFNYKQANFYTNNIIYKEIIYRMWLLSLIVFLILEYIVLPTSINGQTIGMLICKIKIVNNQRGRKLSKSIFDRQRLFAFLWIFVFLSFMLISTDAFLKATKGNKINTIEKLVLSLPALLATIALNVDLFMIITGINSKRLNWNDKFSQTETVWINKFEEVNTEDDEQKIKPIKRELPKINFF